MYELILIVNRTLCKIHLIDFVITIYITLSSALSTIKSMDLLKKTA